MFGKIVLLIIYSFLVLSCSSSRQIDLDESKCIENLAFKKLFFEKIKNIDFLMIEEAKIKSINDAEKLFTPERVKMFDSSLLFISKYSQVSFGSMLNYDNTYPYGVYEIDRKIWLKWYDENKCSNIQIKD